MTEADWLTWTTRPAAMFRQVRGKASGRKLQLLSCACCRMVWDHIPDERCRTGVVLAESFADGKIDNEVFLAARREVLDTYREWVDRSATAADGQVVVMAAAVNVVEAAINMNPSAGLQSAIYWVNHVIGRNKSRDRMSSQTARSRICDLFREIIGNPFRPWAVPAGYPAGGLVQPDGRRVPVTDAVYHLAAGIQADQAFDRLPVLADAAEEAGVTDRELLDHLRHGTGHVRGCWALGVLLGKG